ncbi:fructose-1,6-bisphosphatase [Pontibacter diazotrophicus]|uniref:Fructose-1,6-bisphosphatase class 3 n=1 Tax=Pontibacter diazotrophicus TaxID=1400979 RepID=A0A3D8LHR2_9BACT|nr:fructose-1,6-bisphosphatase [Pontibacter diazotrophicus]RDV16784.1 fructose-1,6-bisphosphatase [Pontibacter diazotrophicus]
MKNDPKYLKLLSNRFPNAAQVGKEIILLEALLSLPKSPELFISDIHGEHETFQHMLRNGSGLIRQKISDLFSETLSEKDLRRLAALIYYPHEKLQIIKRENNDWENFYTSTIKRLLSIAYELTSIYTKRKIDRLLSRDYGLIISELLQGEALGERKSAYNERLLRTVMEIGACDKLIIALAEFIQRIAISKIHVIGDIYDRGPGAETVMDSLIDYHAVDIQWGNHDIVWMGAASGSLACMANVIRLSLRYANTDTLEKGYGINLIPLASFALEHYKEDKSLIFNPKVNAEDLLNESEHWLNRIMHKAISIIQFKLEEQLIDRRPDFRLTHRKMLSNINFDTGEILIEGKTYALKDTYFPTIDPADPTKLSKEEQDLVAQLSESFQHSKRLKEHVQFLFEKGSMYHISNDCLLFHGSIPIDKNGDLALVEMLGKKLKGREYLDFLDKIAREAFSGMVGTAENDLAVDMMWYLWAGPQSPLFGKDKMTTFERYFINDPSIHQEAKGYYYYYRDDTATVNKILEDFGLDAENSIIINGHVPVVVKKGENPIKANGKLIVIDGGFAKAYQSETGIAGYTLIFDDLGKQIIAHLPFESTEKAIEDEIDILSSETLYSYSDKPLKVADIRDGDKIKSMIEDLKDLLSCYRSGLLTERFQPLES